MDKYTHYFSGFESEAEADAWGEMQERHLLSYLGNKAVNYSSNVRTQPNSMTGLWTCEVTVQRV